ncbi:MAG: ATPase, T2SS/T4P/T4SS family [Lachnospiraceae bacterium]
MNFFQTFGTNKIVRNKPRNSMLVANEKKEVDIESIQEELVHDFTTTKQLSLIRMRKGQMSREDFLLEVREHLLRYYALEEAFNQVIMEKFEEFVFGYSKLTSLIDDPDVSDIRCVRYNNIRVKKKGKRMDSMITFSSEKEYRQFIDYIATKNQVSIDNLNAIQRFTDMDSHEEFVLRFTVSMPLVNTYEEPYLCVRKVSKYFPELEELIEAKMLTKEMATMLSERFIKGSTLICGGNSSGKTTILNALKEIIPNDVAVMVAQQADELSTKSHPDMMFLHSLPKVAEGKVSYDLKDISIAALTMDVDFFIVGEIKGEEALYLLNAAYTGQLCSGTIHAPSADKGLNKLVDYAMQASRYSRNELLKMMECFKTIIFMKDYQVHQIFEVRGWDYEKEELVYVPIYQRGQGEL